MKSESTANEGSALLLRMLQWWINQSEVSFRGTIDARCGMRATIPILRSASLDCGSLWQVNSPHIALAKPYESMQTIRPLLVFCSETGTFQLIRRSSDPMRFYCSPEHIPLPALKVHPELAKRDVIIPKWLFTSCWFENQNAPSVGFVACNAGLSSPPQAAFTTQGSARLCVQHSWSQRSRLEAAALWLQP